MKTKAIHSVSIQALTRSPRCRAERMVNRVAVALALLPGLLTLIGCKPKSDMHLLATVGSREIRDDRFQEQMVRRGGARPETLNKEALLEEMIDQEALCVRALQAGLDKDPELQRSWRNLLIGKLKEKELAPRLAKAEVTRAEIETAYAAARDRYTRPQAVRLAVLYLKIDPAMKPDKLAELQARMGAARQKATEDQSGGAPGFGALAITFSEDQATRYSGGIVGWVETNRGPAWLGPRPTAAAFALRNPGDISEVITDSQGIYLLKLLERRDASVTPLPQVEASLKQGLLADKCRAIEQSFIRESRQAVPVQTYPELLARIPSPARGAVAGSQQPPAFP